MLNKILIFTPTYNEKNNISGILDQILCLNLSSDILIIDDNSPDGTASIVEKFATIHNQIKLIKRKKKEGIGSAHKDAMEYSIKNNYKYLITIDADFSHKPIYIPELFKKLENEKLDIVLGSRFINKNSLNDWNISRKIITHFGHFLTKKILNLPYDSSGAFRCYKIENIKDIVKNIKSDDYSFFYESLTLFQLNHNKIGEVAIDLPARVYGNSKMKLIDIVRGFIGLFKLYFEIKKINNQIELLKKKNINLSDPEFMKISWNEYWSGKKNKIDRSLYDVIASFYRRYIIKSTLTRHIKNNFLPEQKILHAGCGGGEVDDDIISYVNITAIDISEIAISKYKLRHSDNAESFVYNIFELHKLNRKFDGIYNLGVMEHFTEEQIIKIFKEFSQSLNPDGKLVLLWPPVYGLSVISLHIIHFFLNKILRKKTKLHPPEPSKFLNKKQIEHFIREANLKINYINFNFRDLFTYSIIVLDKKI